MHTRKIALQTFFIMGKKRAKMYALRAVGAYAHLERLRAFGDMKCTLTRLQLEKAKAGREGNRIFMQSLSLTDRNPNCNISI
jgi:hypothetical protein